MPGCKDCGLFYDDNFDEELHQAFCQARTCSKCKLVFYRPLPVYGQSMIPGEPDTRLCQDCAAEVQEEQITSH